MFFKKLDNGKYRYYEKFYDESEEKWKQVTVTLTSKTRQARGEATRILEAKINRKLLIAKVSKTNAKIAKNITVKEVFDAYLMFRKQELKDSSFVVFNQTLTSVLKDIFTKRINSNLSYHFQDKIVLSTASTAYKLAQKSYANLFFKYAIRMGYLEYNPIENIELPRRRITLEEVERKRAKFLSKEEFNKFKKFFGNSASQIRMNKLIEFLYLTGLRLGEALALKWNNIDIESKLITVKYTLDYQSASIKEFKLSSPKTNNSYRKISINSKCVDILSEMSSLNQTIDTLNREFIFLNSKGSLINYRSLNHYLKVVGKKANIKDKNSEDFSSHMLRHSHISLLTELGVPIKTIMDRVGHKNEKTTIQIYTHVTEKMKADVGKMLENI